jgi:hypothetical protein
MKLADERRSGNSYSTAWAILDPIGHRRRCATSRFCFSGSVMLYFSIAT